ncbi:MAG: DNA-directed RNA polymerase subunit alpha [Armatimonadetes bacterium]|jgi:DNA-directed RNA polymerase subunit alpha|nr:DNA-directed RNA polymerase subunit alpha [Armatimonadota bacterium]HOC31991.1 DNA-directed RNA polymerase subunit alpha [Armatimonadota bacterium]
MEFEAREPREPSEPQVKRLVDVDSEYYGKFEVSPLESGFGTTVGNALRRVLLSSVPGAAITSVKIDRVLHEFSNIPGVREDTTELLLNLKELNIRFMGTMTAGEERELKIAVKGKGEVTGADVQCPEDMEIVNPEAYIATISDEDASLSMELTVTIGKGYVLPEAQEKYKNIIGTIPVGSVFTPVRKVNYSTEPTRVGNRTDFERLVLEIWTNGTISAEAALSQAAEILIANVSLFIKEGHGSPYRLAPVGGGDSALKAPDKKIEELEFSVRTYNCLKKAGIETIADLVKTTEQQLLNIRNLGRVSLDEIKERLAEEGCSLLPSKDGEARPAHEAPADDEMTEEE